MIYEGESDSGDEPTMTYVSNARNGMPMAQSFNKVQLRDYLDKENEEVRNRLLSQAVNESQESDNTRKAEVNWKVYSSQIEVFSAKENVFNRKSDQLEELKRIEESPNFANDRLERQLD